MRRLQFGFLLLNRVLDWRRSGRGLCVFCLQSQRGGRRRRCSVGRAVGDLGAVNLVVATRRNSLEESEELRVISLASVVAGEATRRVFPADRGRRRHWRRGRRLWGGCGGAIGLWRRSGRRHTSSVRLGRRGLGRRRLGSVRRRRGLHRRLHRRGSLSRGGEDFRN